jgi:hypothetical protein
MVPGMLASACGANRDSKTCDTNQDCPSGSVCTSGVCFELCDNDNDCPSSSYVCREGICTEAGERLDGEACSKNSDCLHTCVASLCTATAAYGGDCDDAGDCQAGLSCADLICRRSDGQDCGVGNECVSGFCADSKCCDTACAGTCDVCSASLGAGTDGVCTEAPTACTGDCGVCSAGNCIADQAVCDTCMECTGGGAAFNCTAVGLGVSDAPGCAAPSTCNGSGLCRLGNGATGCTADGDCTSNHCDLSTTVGLETGRCCAAGDCCDSDADCGSGNHCRSSKSPYRYQCVSGLAGCDDNLDCDSPRLCCDDVNMTACKFNTTNCRCYSVASCSDVLP